LLIAGIDKSGVNSTSDILVRGTGNSDTTGFAKCFKPCRDIDAITENVIAFDDQIAEVYTDTEDDAFVFIDRLAFGYGAGTFSC
jgi:hypothetical protein